MTDTFLQDLIKSQQEIAGVSKSALNPHFKSKYTNIKDILEQVKPILNQNNFFLTQKIQIKDDREILKTEIIHVSGKILESEAPLIVADKTNPQKYGAAITYMRRYSITALLGIEEDDDDGNEASKKKPIDKIADAMDLEMKQILREVNEQSCEKIKDALGQAVGLDNLKTIFDEYSSDINKLKKYAQDLYQEVINFEDFKKTELEVKDALGQAVGLDNLRDILKEYTSDINKLKKYAQDLYQEVINFKDKKKIELNKIADAMDLEMKQIVRELNEEACEVVKDALNQAVGLDNLQDIFKEYTSDIDKLKEHTPDLYQEVINFEDFKKTELS